jgi:hypothetical protein
VTKQKIEISVFAGLVALAGLVYLFDRSQGTGVPGVSADVKFSPLSVQEPQLRIDLLAKLQKETNIGSHRNIFNATPPPVELTPAQRAAAQHQYPTVPPPPLPQPVQVPGEFFGTAFRPASGKRFGFWKNGDDIFVVAEGDSFLNNYRLIHIANDTADVEEISTGRHARVTMAQPANPGASLGPITPGEQQATPE